MISKASVHSCFVFAGGDEVKVVVFDGDGSSIELHFTEDRAIAEFAACALQALAAFEQQS